MSAISPISSISPRQRARIEQIQALKREKGALILVHNYLLPEIYEVADYIGDSLGLCEEAAATDASIIVFSAVHFMAESAALLLPDRKILLPNYDAGCALAEMVSAPQLRTWRAQHPDVTVVCYINSSAAVKAESDVVCTSTNAIAVVRALSADRILMVPDKNLAHFVQRAVPEKEIIAWDGYCPIHHRITLDAVMSAREAHPNAKLLVHPECPPDVLNAADVIASTNGMFSFAERDSADEFIVVTECGLVKRMMKELPNKKFLSVCNLCYDMKKTTLDSIYDSLVHEQYRITVEPEIANRARRAFVRMFELTRVTPALPALSLSR